MPNEEERKIALFMAKPRENTDLLTPIQIEKLRELIKTTCKVEFRFHQPLVMNDQPITIEGLKIIRQEELDDGSTLIVYEIPEGVDPADLLPLWPSFGPIDPEQDFYKDYDDGA